MTTERAIQRMVLVNVDNTLITPSAEASVIDDSKDIESQLSEMINDDFLRALKVSGWMDVCLFTDMSLTPSQIKERSALVNILEKQGFTVHAVVTPPDMGWHLPVNQLKAFHESQEAQAALTQLTNSETKEAAQAEEREKLTQYVNSIFTDVPPVKPGTAFKEAKEAFEKNTDNKELESKCPDIVAKAGMIKRLLTAKTLLAKRDHIKSKMFEHFIQNSEHKCFDYVVADDDLSVLHSIEQADLGDSNLLVAPIYVNNNNKRKKPGEQTKGIASYLQGINAPFALRTLCQGYMAHLWDEIQKSQRTLKDKAGDSVEGKAESSLEEESENIKLARRKLKVVTEMNKTLTGVVNDQKLKMFHRQFLDHRDLIETRRDSYSMFFLKMVATFFSLGIAAACGLWRVKGREVARDIDFWLPPQQPSPALSV